MHDKGVLATECWTVGPTQTFGAKYFLITRFRVFLCLASICLYVIKRWQLIHISGLSKYLLGIQYKGYKVSKYQSDVIIIFKMAVKLYF